MQNGSDNSNSNSSNPDSPRRLISGLQFQLE